MGSSSALFSIFVPDRSMRNREVYWGYTGSHPGREGRFTNAFTRDFRFFHDSALAPVSERERLGVTEPIDRWSCLRRVMAQ